MPPAVLVALASTEAIDQVGLVKRALGIRQWWPVTTSRANLPKWGGRHACVTRAGSSGGAPHSPWLTWYYLRRWGELGGRYGKILLVRRQGPLRDATQVKVQLTTWLEDHS